jgi:hypothetical protein
MPSFIRRVFDRLREKLGFLRPLGDERFALGLFIVVFILGLVARAWAAPYSASQDMAQFWSFAQQFKEHGLDYYRYYKAIEDINPFYAWGYFYPPIWLLLLGLALAAVPFVGAGETFVDTAWRIAMKTPIISADMIIGLLLYIAIPGSPWRKLFFAGIWVLNPAAWYQSGVFGQFDAIAAAFLLGSLVLLERGQDRWAFAVAALAFLTKQHTWFPIAFMLSATIRTMPLPRFMTNVAIFGGVIIAISLSFLVTGNAEAYARALLLPGQQAGYQLPIVYAFSGSGALATYLHENHGFETVSWLKLNVPILGAAVIGGLTLSFFKNITPLRAALIGILLFIALYYRINYQYLVVFIPLALLAASRTSYYSERFLGLALAVVPSIWLWYFNVSFWFYWADPKYPYAFTFFERFGWTHEIGPDIVYVALALVINALCLAYIIFAFTRWRRPYPDSPTLPELGKSSARTTF